MGPWLGRTFVFFKVLVIGHHPVNVCLCLSVYYVCVGIFVAFTLTAVMALIVFWRKSNSVFALQKCEQRDIDDEVITSDVNLPRRGGRVPTRIWSVEQVCYSSQISLPRFTSSYILYIIKR